MDEVAAVTEQGFKAWRKRCDLTRHGAADFLGLSISTIDSYQIGRRPVPQFVEAAMARHPGERRARMRSYIEAQLPSSMGDIELSSAFVGEVLLGFVELV